jgi:hypothetical protein
MITFTSLQSKYPFNDAYTNAYTTCGGFEADV